MKELLYSEHFIKRLYVQLLQYLNKTSFSLHACFRFAYFIADWSHHFWRSYFPFWHRILHKKYCYCNSSYILNRNFLKLCMIVYYHMEICIVVWQVNRISFKGVIDLFEYVSKNKKDRNCLCTVNFYILNQCFIELVWYVYIFFSNFYRICIAFPKWYSCKIAELALNKNHWLTHSIWQRKMGEGDMCFLCQNNL